MQKISPCLWFNGQAEDAARFYVSVFKNSKVGLISRYGEGAPWPKGTVLAVKFRLGGNEFVALNGGPEFQFSEAISFIVPCKTQRELDRLWQKLTEGGQEGQCGWLKDRFGVSWQIIPDGLIKMLSDPNQAKAGRAMQAMMGMKKLDLAGLKRAYQGK